MENLEFVDAQEMHKNNPDTFKVPSISKLMQIKKGTFIKVCIGSERFWAEVTEIKNQNEITAVVDNDLVNTDVHGIKYKDRIHVETRHVFETLR